MAMPEDLSAGMRWGPGGSATPGGSYCAAPGWGGLACLKHYRSPSEFLLLLPRLSSCRLTGSVYISRKGGKLADFCNTADVES